MHTHARTHIPSVSIISISSSSHTHNPTHPPLPLLLRALPKEDSKETSSYVPPYSESESRERMEGDRSSSRRELTALVVDDQELLRKIHEKMLKSAGVGVVEAVENGKEAIDIHRAGRSFDLILMDLDMPIMNGIEATKGLRAMGVKGKIAGVSAREEEGRVKEFMEAGLDLSFQKPLTSIDLSSLVRQINPL